MTKVRVLRYDSDTVFSTNNEVLLNAFEYKDTLMCVQSNMPKKVPTEDDFIASDINGFGDSIGSVTNRGTNMISLREKFDKNSEEYNRLQYRIRTMMNYQQNAIDRIKGVVAQPIPKEWLESRFFKPEDGENEDILRKKEIDYNIAAEIKPWFFIYRYSQLKTELDKYVKSVKSNCKIRFGKTLDDLYASDNRTEEEDAFIYNYEKYMPISRAPGTMNRICWKIEDEFKFVDVLPDVEFDREILKSDAVYSKEEYDAIKELYDEYGKSLLLISKGRKQNETTSEDVEFRVVQLKESFMDNCLSICPNSEILANIVVDICYSSNKSKSFAWDIAGDEIFENVLKKNGGKIQFPVKDENGDIEFCGEKFSLCTKVIGGDKYDDFK